ncbi:hypothetical protein [Microbulbifer halophilus]|uniref:hypothetical protein n=1 Tax=Microbulbifer halophilus TaxID=453963 RepID=UPI00361C0614
MLDDFSLLQIDHMQGLHVCHIETSLGYRHSLGCIEPFEPLPVDNLAINRHSADVPLTIHFFRLSVDIADVQIAAMRIGGHRFRLVQVVDLPERDWPCGLGWRKSGPCHADGQGGHDPKPANDFSHCTVLPGKNRFDSMNIDSRREAYRIGFLVQFEPN